MRPGTPPPRQHPPWSTLSRKRTHSCSPTKAHRHSFTQSDLFSIPLGLTGYTIFYRPGWSPETTATRFISEYSLGPEWRWRIETVLREQIIPSVSKAIAEAEEARLQFKENTSESRTWARRARC